MREKLLFCYILFVRLSAVFKIVDVIMKKLFKGIAIVFLLISLFSAQSSATTKNKKSATTLNTQTSTTAAEEQAQYNAEAAKRIAAKKNAYPDLRALISQQQRYLPFDPDVPGQAFVSTGPYIGVPFQFSGSELVVNTPSVNQDVTLLNLRKHIHEELLAMGGELLGEVSHSHLLLSGVLEAQANYTGIGGGAKTTDIDVTNVSLDGYILGPTSWTSGFFEFSYNNNVGGGTNSRTANSSMFVNKAFFIIGDFSRTPFYSTIGQYYVPFGTYASVLVSSTLPKSLARTKERAWLVGYQQQGSNNKLYGSAYIFRGDSHASAVTRINNGGINVGWRMNQSNFSHGIGMDIGGGVIANLADSVGMQLSGQSPYGGFGSTTAGNEKLVHRVPAYNVRGYFDLGPAWDVIAEYVGASTQFNPNNMSFGGSGAKPWAVDTEVAYSFSAFDRPTSLGVGYAWTKEALALGLPEQRYSAVINTSVWRNTLQSLEYRRDINYAASATASGSDIVVNPASGLADNIVTFQFDYYF